MLSMLCGLTNLGGHVRWMTFFIGAFVRLYSLNKSREVHGYKNRMLQAGAPFKFVTVERDT